MISLRCVVVSGTKIILRDTSIMPDIPGLPALITMLFTPIMELRSDRINFASLHTLKRKQAGANWPHFLFGFRTNEERSCYTGALCGLGWNSHTKEAILPEQDIELTFDVKFDVEDISDVRRRCVYVVMMMISTLFVAVTSLLLLHKVFVFYV